jgi:hypothetical protein
MQELSLVKFFSANFYALLLSARPFHPIHGTLLKTTKSLVNSEPEDKRDKKILEKLEYIEHFTHPKVSEPLSVIELAVYRRIFADLQTKIRINEKEWSLMELYMYLDEVTQDLNEIVVQIAKNYSLDIPMHFNSHGGTQNIGFNQI